MIILDASALLAYLHRETGWEAVQGVLANGCIGAVNWSEVARKISQKGMDIAVVRDLLEELGVTIIPFSAGQAELAAQLWKEGRHHGLSLADRACLALAMERDTPVVTADKAWVGLTLDIEMQFIR